jgi:uncharacterized protein YcbK (DUF882 family)
MNRRALLAFASGFAAFPRWTQADPVAPVPRRLKLTNIHTSETFEGPYRDNDGPLASAMDDLSNLLRDHRSGATVAVDIRLIDFLAAVMDAVGAGHAIVLSAYRTPATNALLARTTFGVADNSQHLYGRALDVRIEGHVASAMAAARAMRRGGVGWYPHSGFFHLVTGPVRTWTLDSPGLDRLLLRLRDLLARDGLSISNAGELRLGHKARPLSPQERLALHRVIAKAGALSVRP